VVWFWNEISAALRRRRPGWRQFFLQKLGSRPESGWKYGELYHTGWPLQRRLDDAAPLPDRFPALGAWCRALPRQLAALRRYRRLELSEGFRSTFRFAGADVSSLIVPELRNAVAKMAEWERGAAARVEALRSIGNVAAMVVAEEFYPTAMQDLAAARELGIPTIGAQHGTIMPTHLVYTVPRGQVEHAPVPDFFAAFSEYAKETVSEIGSYPAERVWVTGSPRFDYLVNTPPDRSQARRMLNLPADKRIILVANQTFAWFPRVVEATIAWARDREDCLVCVKTHPKRLAMRAGEFQRMAARLGADNVLCYEDRFAELLAACDVLISGSSTTVLEAALLGRGTICVNFSDEPDWYPYVADGGALRAKSESELALRLAELLEGDADAQERIVTGRMEFLRRHAGPAGEGRAAEELADRIEALIEGRVPALPVVRQKEAAEPALCG
jgi:hypothetical protein